MDTADSDFPAGDIRVSDAERDRAVAELSAALQAGRITTEEFGERSGQVLAARTGKELTGPLADLPRAARPAPVPRKASLTQAQRSGCRVGAGAAIVIGLFSAVDSVARALAPPTISAAQRELARQIVARQGFQVPPGWPPNPGFDWAGTITSAVVAVLLIGLGIFLLRRANRA
jgi:hypothetical protein